MVLRLKWGSELKLAAPGMSACLFLHGPRPVAAANAK
jgi:hypothetical protein